MHLIAVFQKEYVVYHNVSQEIYEVLQQNTSEKCQKPKIKKGWFLGIFMIKAIFCSCFYLNYQVKVTGDFHLTPFCYKIGSVC